ncbi:MAG: prolipoprotein diacylglyceryl transferase [Candidatus Neomarinimicrobiota bacterium]|nr:prolipoprotein diacylglyceryl transferase [Candidatus Neomarinimicrobiota bacterium]
MDFILWWQTLPSKMDPILLSIGSFSIYWYSTMYLVAFGVVYLLCRSKINNKDYTKLTLPEFEDLLSWCFIALIIGARLGYVLFYNFEYYIDNPLEILLPFSIKNGVWKFTGIAGMSYHGGVIGVLIAIWMYASKKGLHLYTVADFLTPAIPLGYFFGRIGNFINGELYGRVTEASIGMYFPNSGDYQLRHPSQLYEAFFEGIVLYFLIKSLKTRFTFLGFNSGLYVFGYAFFRFFIEYFREPDNHLGFILLDLSMGQLLCIAMMAGGIVIWLTGYKTVTEN